MEDTDGSFCLTKPPAGTVKEELLLTTVIAFFAHSLNKTPLKVLLYLYTYPRNVALYI